MKNYKAIGKIGEGTFSEVLKVQSLRDGNSYACKQMKQHFESDRKSGSLALICELMDMNIYELIRGRRYPLSEQRVMHYMYQLCKSLDHMHRNGIFHRDVKPENILIKQDVLKLGDFGSCRSVYSKQPYTEYISTRWYRAPECLLTDGFYSYKMDLWSAGCVFYEITSLQPLFPGANELDQISKIHDVIGTPAEKTLTKFKQSRAMSFDFPFKKGSGIPLLTASLSPQCLSLLHAMVAYDPDERISAHQALQHPSFQEQRAAERQALANHRRACFSECPVGPDLSTDWQTARESRKQVPGAAGPWVGQARHAEEAAWASPRAPPHVLGWLPKGPTPLSSWSQLPGPGRGPSESAPPWCQEPGRAPEPLACPPQVPLHAQTFSSPSQRPGTPRTLSPHTPA
ncbi:MAPK/MAK/MRK overlapping kinase isoform X3 [Erinaceus europaeus]|uniref:MAPK/MAK/MRK overlapping kinase isoform X3 n=1 Tax=Erinaceus europaeus TaxID=9365 RepID=A0ABM3WKH0_ERIEU|nr:MAPK/MAK/MRK overlapping kinase isoform X3 [Erinaceus europaeus]